ARLSRSRAGRAPQRRKPMSRRRAWKRPRNRVGKLRAWLFLPEWIVNIRQSAASQPWPRRKQPKEADGVFLLIQIATKCCRSRFAERKSHAPNDSFSFTARWIL